VVHPGAELYGADRMLLNSVAALARTFDVTVALPTEGPLVAELARLDVRVLRCRMPVLRNDALRGRGARRLLVDAVLGALPALRLARRYGGAGVYVNTVTLPSWPLWARLAGRRSLCHVHEAERSLSPLLRRALAVGPALSDRVLVNSRFTLEALTEVAPRLAARSTVLHNAVLGPAEAGPAPLAPSAPLRLLFAGRLSPRKGPHVAVDVLRELIDRGVDARLVLVGAVFPGYEWFERDLRRAVATAGLTGRVEFAGFLPDVWPAMAAADVILVPSTKEESFGNTAVEAVLAARPLVVSDHSGLREAVAGYTSVQTADPGRPAEWADAVERIANDRPAFRRAALADAADARRRHDAGRYGEQLVGVVAALARAGRRDRAGRPGPPMSVPGPPSRQDSRSGDSASRWMTTSNRAWSAAGTRPGARRSTGGVGPCQ
jgi:glycosyltransferase involved in cell wall biosynthesis